MLSRADETQREELKTRLKSKVVAQLAVSIKDTFVNVSVETSCVSFTKHLGRCESWAQDLARDRSQEIARLKRERYEA
jgi:hypothetical protein